MAKQKKKNNGEHIARMEARKKERERLTNWYMINLGWGLVGLVVLTFIYYGYRSTSMLLHMPTIIWVMTGVFAVAALVVFLLGLKGVIHNRSRANHYAILLAVCTVASLWLAFYNQIRVVLENVLRSVTGNSALSVGSYWNVWTLMIGIGVYLVIAFIWYLVKERRL